MVGAPKNTVALVTELKGTKKDGIKEDVLQTTQSF